MELKSKASARAAIKRAFACVATVAMLGGAVELSSQSTDKAEAASATVNNLGPAPAKFGYVNKAVLPLAKDFIKTFRRAKRSEKEVERHTAGIYLDNVNLTKLTIEVPVRVRGDRSPRGGAYYDSDALFMGSIRPKNLVEIDIAKYAEAHRYLDRGFGLIMGKTKNPGPFGIVTPRLWTMNGWVKGGGEDLYDSCAINGERGYWPTLSRPIVNAGISEARKVLRQTRNRRPLGKQRDVFAGMKPARYCFR